MTDFSLRTTAAFPLGVYLVANAVPDSLLVFRGSACVYEAFEAALRPHDFGQTLGDAISPRLVDTTEPFTTSILGVEGRVADLAGWSRFLADKRLVFLGELVRISIMGEGLRAAARVVTANTGLPCVPALSLDLSRDADDALRSLLTGMAQVLAAEGSPSGGEAATGEGGLEPRSVGIVGYPFLRHEGDSEGDIAELERLVRTLGLDPAPIWLSGAGWEHLRRLARARHLLALPLGVDAARSLARASGASVTEVPLPVSLGQCEEWLRALAATAGAEAAVDAVLDAELARVVPLADRLVSLSLRGRRVAVIADPSWLPGLVRCFEEDLGLEVVCALWRTRRNPHGEASTDRDEPSRDYDPSAASLAHHLEAAQAAGGLDAIVGSTFERNALPVGLAHVPFVEFGFPQHTKHYLVPTPHLGFSGVLTWAQRLHDALVSAP